MLRPRSQPNSAALLAVAVMLSTGAAVTVDAARLMTPGRCNRAELLKHVAKVVRAMHVPRVVASQRYTPKLAAALRPVTQPTDDLHLSSEPYHPQLLNLPPPSRAILA